MRGVSFPEQTTVYGKPEGWKDEDCYGLPVCQSVYENSEGKDVPNLVSYWERQLTDAEIETIVRNRKLGIFLSITGTGMPPVSVSIESPFPADYDKAGALRRHNKFREGHI